MRSISFYSLPFRKCTSLMMDIDAPKAILLILPRSRHDKKPNKAAPTHRSVQRFVSSSFNSRKNTRYIPMLNGIYGEAIVKEEVDFLKAFIIRTSFIPPLRAKWIHTRLASPSIIMTFCKFFQNKKADLIKEDFSIHV
ncbi:hypothetical protein AT864_00878 [Anoxybacillus sp. P3H1B]|jgi:hypothetical protein|nr:hypothetical protein AT864_00878 [Anoxybacillus sp. P3H1B]